MPVNCGPKGLPTDTNLLYRNNGNGTFSDVSAASRIASVTGRYPMTALAADLDDDGWTDIYVASDSTAAIHYRNNRDGTFTDVALQSGTAFSEQGNPQAGMGAALGDVNGDGRLDVLKTHFADDIPALYQALGRGLFEDVAVPAGLNVQNRHVEWGAGLPDLDNDGRADVHVRHRPRVSRSRARPAAVPASRSAGGLPQPRRRPVCRRHGRRAAAAHALARAAAPRSATSTTTATSTCW